MGNSKDHPHVARQVSNRSQIMKPSTRNFFAASLRAGQFQPRKVKPIKGKGSYRRHDKHKGRASA